MNPVPLLMHILFSFFPTSMVFS